MARKVLVSGAARGLGHGLVAEYAARGFDVFAGTRNGEETPGTSIVLDVTDEASTRDAVASAAASGPIDILINNAGVHVGGRLDALAEADFRHIVDVNLFGAWRLSKLAIPQMRPGGTIVMISSLSGLVGLPEDGAYAASKFALEGMSQSLAGEVAPLGLRVVLIEPGGIATGFAGSVDGDDPRDVARQIADIVEKAEHRLRYTIGKTGAFVAERLDLDTGERVESIVKTVTGDGWEPRV